RRPPRGPRGHGRAAGRRRHRTAVAPGLFWPGPRLVRHRYHKPLRSPGVEGRTLHHRGIRFDLRRAARLDREPRPVREYLYRCACDPALNLALIPKIKREGPRVRIPLPPALTHVRTREEARPAAPPP